MTERLNLIEVTMESFFKNRVLLNGYPEESPKRKEAVRDLHQGVIRKEEGVHPSVLGIFQNLLKGQFAPEAIAGMKMHGCLDTEALLLRQDERRVKAGAE